MTDAAERLVAERLAAARGNSPGIPWREILPPDQAAAYRVQDETCARLGPVGAWKVGASSPVAEPTCAPCPAAGILPSGTALTGPAWRLRGIEAEVALRLGRDLDGPVEDLTREVVEAAVEAVFPVIEVVETRLAGFAESDPLAQLADLLSHGALILGDPAPVRAGEIDLAALTARVTFDGRTEVERRGGHAARDVWRLLVWLARHCVARGQPLRAGQIVTTGSCTGVCFAPAGARVSATLEGVGSVEVRF